MEKRTGVDAGSDLASLVIAHHRENHMREPEQCGEQMCIVAAECIRLDEAFYGTDA